jgi:DHA1 family bicyclomycin/chloramphenicol resistance-like MFS transporter
MAPRKLNAESPRLLLLLAAMVALGPLSVDMYLPAMPAMMQAFGTDISSMHLTLSAYLTGFALFHLFCGPLADRFGRKPLLLGGTGLFIVASMGCSLSSTVEELLVFRLLQGIGACVGPTLARTVTRDIFGPVRAARALSLIAMLMALAPAIAPTLGGLMLLTLPWPSIFVFLGIYAGVMLILIAVFLEESLPQRQSLHPRAIIRNFAEVLLNPDYLQVTLAGGLAYSALMAYLSSSSFVYIDMLGVPVEYFGLTFLPTVIGYMAGSGVSARLSSYHDSERLVLYGALAAMTATASMWTLCSLFPGSVAALMLPMMLYTAALGLILPQSMAIALRPFPHIAGTASSLLGFIQMSLSALVSALVGSFLKESPQPMLISMFLVSVAVTALSLRAFKRYRQTKL